MCAGQCGDTAVHGGAETKFAELRVFVVGKGFWRVGVVAHDGTDWEDDSARGEVACPSEIWLLKIGKPIDDFLGLAVGEEDADLAFYLLVENQWLVVCEGRSTHLS